MTGKLSTKRKKRGAQNRYLRDELGRVGKRWRGNGGVGEQKFRVAARSRWKQRLGSWGENDAAIPANVADGGEFFIQAGTDCCNGQTAIRAAGNRGEGQADSGKFPGGVWRGGETLFFLKARKLILVRPSVSETTRGE